MQHVACVSLPILQPPSAWTTTVPSSFTFTHLPYTEDVTGGTTGSVGGRVGGVLIAGAAPLPSPLGTGRRRLAANGSRIVGAWKMDVIDGRTTNAVGRATGPPAGREAAAAGMIVGGPRTSTAPPGTLATCPLCRVEAAGVTPSDPGRTLSGGGRPGDTSGAPVRTFADKCCRATRTFPGVDAVGNACPGSVCIRGVLWRGWRGARARPVTPVRTPARTAEGIRMLGPWCGTPGSSAPVAVTAGVRKAPLGSPPPARLAGGTYGGRVPREAGREEREGGSEASSAA